MAQQGKGKQQKELPQAHKEDELSKAQALFDSLKDAAGNVATIKLSDYLKKQGMDDGWVAKALDQIDVNHDSEITWAEFATKGIRIVQQLKIHADQVARESAKKQKQEEKAVGRASASKEVEQAPPKQVSQAPPAKEVEVAASSPKQGASASPAPAHRDSPSNAPASAKGEKGAKGKGAAKGAKGGKGSKDPKPAETAPAVADATFGLPPSAFEDVAPRKTLSKNIAHRLKLRDLQLVVEAIQQTKPAGEYQAGRRKKKFLPNKPTHDEKGVYKRLKKHEVAKAPAYEKVLLDKYKIKKKPAPAAAKK